MPKKEVFDLITEEFRVSFPNVFTARTFEDGDPKFELVMLFDKEKTDLAPLRAILQKAAQQRWPNITKAQFAQLRDPIRDGDDKDYDGYKGHWFVRASSKYQPQVINLAEQELNTPEEFYAGCYARAKVNSWAYDTKGNKGLSLGLLSVLFIRDGEKFSNRANAAEDFAGLTEPAAPEEDGFGDNGAGATDFD